MIKLGQRIGAICRRERLFERYCKVKCLQVECVNNAAGCTQAN